MDSYLSLLIVIFIALVIAGGMFILFIISLGCCRRSRLEKENKKQYKAVLKLLENPRNLIFACRLWNNILKVIAVFTAAAICLILLHIIDPGGAHSAPGKPDAFLLIFIILYILSVGIIITLLGDSLPKLLSHTKPEKIASALLPVMKFFSVFMLPFTLPAIKFSLYLNKKIHPEITDNSITEEELQDELRYTLIEGEKSGVVESKERDMVEGVFYLGDRSVGAFMTHRSEIQWLDINAPYEEIRKKAVEYRDQRCFPVVNANPDEIIGAVFLEDIILDCSLEKPRGLRSIMKKAQFVPETMPAIKAFESFKHGQSNFLFVMDEYGGLAGLISITALVEEIVGELSSAEANEDPPLLLQEDGTYLADGSLNIDDAVKSLSIIIDKEGEFHTLAGLILHLAEELPHVGDSFEFQGYSFKVVDKDGNRIDKLLIKKIDK
jgi:putative hemolysin